MSKTRSSTRRSHTPSFLVSDAEARVITAIADRASECAERAGHVYSSLDARMDITAVHANGCPLRLQDLRDADNLNFTHDVFGIRRHLDRHSGKLTNSFLPRFAA